MRVLAPFTMTGIAAALVGCASELPGHPPALADAGTVGAIDSDAGVAAECSPPAPPAAGEPSPLVGAAVPFQGVKVTTSGSGHGTVTATVDGAACDAQCLERLPTGTPIHLIASADPGSWFHGWFAGCSGRHACDVIAADNLLIIADFTPEPNRVFMSSIVHDGDFGGIQGGDALCQQLATSAGLTGTYHIVLNTGTADAMSSWRSRAPGARGWIRVDGEPVGDTDLGDCAGPNNIRLDESGNDVGVDRYWAFPRTTFGGSTHCSNWTSNGTGITADVQANYNPTTQAVRINERIITLYLIRLNPCNTPLRFVCAEVDRSVAITLVVTKGRLAFMSTGSWDTTAGIAAADSMCAAEARAAGKPGSFKALIATSTASAISRFNTDGPPWVRVDGVPLLPTAKSFESATYLDVAPGIGIDGTLQPLYTSIALGSPDLHTPGTLSSTCNDWTSGNSTQLSPGFGPWDTNPTNTLIGCFTSKVLCLEE